MTKLDSEQRKMLERLEHFNQDSGIDAVVWHYLQREFPDSVFVWVSPKNNNPGSGREFSLPIDEDANRVELSRALEEVLNKMKGISE